MIKLILTSKIEDQTYAFDKTSICIGRPSLEVNSIDLVLPGDGVATLEVTIEEVQGHFLVFNNANNPFTTLNELPFAKKKIKNGDLLEIGEALYIFEGQPSTATESSPPLKNRVEPKMHLNNARTQQIKPIAQQNVSDEELEDLLQQVEALDNTEEPESIAEQDLLKIKSSVEKRKIPPAPIMQLSRASKVEVAEKEEYDEDKAIINRKPLEDVAKIKVSAFFSIVVGIALLLSIVSIISYTIIKERSEEDEMKAAAMVADVTMALNFAQINHAKPQNQNWSDPEFLKINLNAILATEFQPLSMVDSHGHFRNSSYMLRIYTGKDLRHFLVIAQPSPSLMQWLVPKTTIIVDSHSMQLRKMADLKILNPLLINATLDESNSDAIADLLQNEEQIPLSFLRKYYGNKGFSTPKALALIRPGAENYIYNAMRYYQLGESLIKKAISLYESHDNHADVPLLVQEINEFMKFPDIVLYTSEGLKPALQGQKAIATFIPKYKLLFGYLQHQSKQGHLLIDKIHNEYSSDSPQALLALATSENITDEMPIESNFESPDILAVLQQQKIQALQAIDEKLAALSLNDGDEEKTTNEISRLNKQYRKIEKQFLKKTVMALSLLAVAPELKIDNEIRAELEKAEDNDTPDKEDDPEHPLYYRFLALKNEKDDKLLKIKWDITSLTEKQGNTPTVENRIKLQRLGREYQKTQDELQKKTTNTISQLQQEYSELPISQFMAYLRAAGLEDNVESKPPTEANTQEIDIKIEDIDRASSLHQLDHALTEISLLLNMEHFSYPALLKTYQNKVRAATVKKLDLFLLSSQKLLPEAERNESARKILQNAFKKAWMTDENENDYYLDEFDLLINCN